MTKKLIILGMVTMLFLTGCNSSKGEKGKDKEKEPSITITGAATLTPSIAKGTPTPVEGTPTPVEGTPTTAPGPTAKPTVTLSPIPTPDLSNVPEGYYVKWLLTEEVDGERNLHSVYEYDELGNPSSVLNDPSEGTAYKTNFTYRYEGENFIKEEISHSKQGDTVNRSIYRNDQLIEQLCIEQLEGQEDRVRSHRAYTYDADGRVVKEVFVEEGSMKYLYLYTYSGSDLVRWDIYSMRSADEHRLYRYDDNGNCIHEEVWMGSTLWYTYDSEYGKYGPTWEKETASEEGEEILYNYKYDAGGNLIYRSTLQPGATDPDYVTYAYENNHMINSKWYSASGELIEDNYWDYDGDLLIKEYTLNAKGKALRSIEYTYDEYGNLIKKENKREDAETWTSTWRYRPIILPKEPEDVIEKEVPRSFYLLERGYNGYSTRQMEPLEEAPEKPPVMGTWKATRFMFVKGTVDPYNYFVKKVGRPTHYATLIVKDGIANTGIYLKEGNNKYTLDRKAEYSIADDVEVIVFTDPKIEGAEGVLEVVQYQVNGDWDTFNKMYSNPTLAEVWVEDGKIVRVLFRV